jgi:hypothetical protein
MTDKRTERDKADEPPRETVSFVFDRMTVARFREVFPNARWSDRLQAWTVPGKTARRRIDQWLASEADRRAPYEEERGRDAFEFEPILSPYLQVYDRGFRIRTPYSRTVVDELRQIPFARWNGDDKVWEIPFASYDDLQHVGDDRGRRKTVRAGRKSKACRRPQGHRRGSEGETPHDRTEKAQAACVER